MRNAHIDEALRQLRQRLRRTRQEILQTWRSWHLEHPMELSKVSEAEARSQLEDAIERMNQASGAAARAPWQRARG